MSNKSKKWAIGARFKGHDVEYFDTLQTSRSLSLKYLDQIKLERYLRSLRRGLKVKAGLSRYHF